MYKLFKKTTSQPTTIQNKVLQLVEMRILGDDMDKAFTGHGRGKAKEEKRMFNQSIIEKQRSTFNIKHQKEENNM